jgi:hypothetical protein
MPLPLQPSLPKRFRLSTQDSTRSPLHRIYWPNKKPLEPSIAGGNRYDCTSKTNPFGVLYLAFDLDTCWMETVVRANMVRRAGAKIAIPKKKVIGRWACEVVARDSIVLATFADEPLIHLGECVSNIMADSYLRTSEWSRLLHSHSHPVVDGIYYRSRFKSDQFCVALFDRAITSKGLRVRQRRDVSPSVSPEVSSLMRRYRVVPI